MLAGIKNKSKRDVEGLLSRVTMDGRILDREPEVELRMKLTASQISVLDRAREVLSHGGHVPSLPDIMIKALGDLLDKRDPLRKAERAAARREKTESPSPGKEGVQLSTMTSESASPGKDGRPSIPASIRHIVWLRDGGRCTWTHPDGTRCPERSMLELDHIEMWCRGGEHVTDNLTLRCRNRHQHEPTLRLIAKFDSPFRPEVRLEEVLGPITMLEHESGSGEISSFFETAFSKDCAHAFATRSITKLRAGLQALGRPISLICCGQSLEFIRSGFVS